MWDSWDEQLMRPKYRTRHCFGRSYIVATRYLSLMSAKVHDPQKGFYLYTLCPMYDTPRRIELKVLINRGVSMSGTEGLCLPVPPTFCVSVSQTAIRVLVDSSRSEHASRGELPSSTYVSCVRSYMIHIICHRYHPDMRTYVPCGCCCCCWTSVNSK